MRLVLRNRIFLATDLVGWSLVPVLALALRLDGFGASDNYAAHLAAFTALAIIAKFTAFWLFGLYRRYWLYASVTEMALIGCAVAAAGIGAAGVYWFTAGPLLPAEPALPGSVPIIDAMLTLIFAGVSRFTVRLWHGIRTLGRANGAHHRVLIVGAGDAGAMVVRELHANPELGLEPVGFLDDNPAKVGSSIHGLPVLATRRALADVATEYGVDEVIIAMPNAQGAVVREIRDACDKAKLKAKTIPGFYEIITGRVNVTQLRDVQIEDLLRRKPVQTDERAVAQLVRGMPVLVTGAGGSIGSEICRQVARFGARELILLGHGENTIYDIYNELLAKYPALPVHPVIADMRDRRRLIRIFDTYRPQAVFHAAAHKHVPLMELNPEEAITNNLQGTANAVEVSEQFNVEHFVFISTDKAVNPVNVMGATKLLAEMVVHDAALRTGKPYVSVRFGNVLASRGSVVPLFQKQIVSGGPVTVTHPEMTRYFMTIPEAVQLVLQAAALGRGGETFVLDMGQPVRILDLARDLVQLSGLELGRDIDIAFTGLRPGEKLFEELFSSSEEFKRTEHDKILVVRNGTGPEAPMQRIVELVTAAEAGDGLRVRQKLVEMVPGYGGGNGRTSPPLPAPAAAAPRAADQSSRRA